MWQQILLAIAGLSAGFAVAGGMFAFIIALGLVSRFAGKTHTAKYVFWYEDAVALGGIFGNLISVYPISLPVGVIGAGIFGIFAGLFVGAWAMALTEVVNIIPIFSRKITLRRGIELVVLSMALGRTFGALIYFVERW